MTKKQAIITIIKHFRSMGASYPELLIQTVNMTINKNKLKHNMTLLDLW